MWNSISSKTIPNIRASKTEREFIINGKGTAKGFTSGRKTAPKGNIYNNDEQEDGRHGASLK